MLFKFKKLSTQIILVNMKHMGVFQRSFSLVFPKEKFLLPPANHEHDHDNTYLSCYATQFIESTPANNLTAVFCTKVVYFHFKRWLSWSHDHFEATAQTRIERRITLDI